MRNPLYGLMGLGLGVAGCLIFVALLMLADQVTWLNPQVVVILVLVLGFSAFVLGICSIKTIPGILSTGLGFLMLAFFLVVFPAWTTVSQPNPPQINKIQNSDDLQNEHVKGHEFCEQVAVTTKKTPFVNGSGPVI